MDAIPILTIILMVTTTAFSRGPHHPRGQSIVKHHVHYRPTKNSESRPEKLTQDAQLLHDKEHIQEDLGEWIQEKDLESMTDDELEFHYFQLHDFDSNKHLDGLEILQAIHHTVSHDEETGEELAETQSDMEYYVELIDKVLGEDDVDNDGYLSYPEYVAGKKKNTIKDVVPVPKVESV